MYSYCRVMHGCICFIRPWVIPVITVYFVFFSPFGLLIIGLLFYLQVKEQNFRPKCIYAAVMLRRMLDAILNSDTFDDKVDAALNSVPLSFYFWQICNYGFLYSTENKSQPRCKKTLKKRYMLHVLVDVCHLKKTWQMTHVQ